MVRQEAEIRESLESEEVKRWIEEDDRICTENACLRDRLDDEMGEKEIHELFQKNEKFFERVWAGETDSMRYKAFHNGAQSRHALMFRMIVHPFGDDHLKWVLDDITVRDFSV